MLQLGRKIYFDKLTGEVLVDTGEKSGNVRLTTVEEDFQVFSTLKIRVPETVGMIQLEYGQYAQDFSACNGYKVNPDKSSIEFSYLDPNQSVPQDPVYQRPLSEEVADLKQAIAELSMMMVTPQ